MQKNGRNSYHIIIDLQSSGNNKSIKQTLFWHGQDDKLLSEVQLEIRHCRKSSCSPRGNKT